MSLEVLVYIPVVILIIIIPFISKWYHKQGLNNKSSISSEIRIKWQSFGLNQKKRPYSGWYTSTSGTLIVTHNSIYLGQISIPFKEVKKAILFKLEDSMIKEFSSILRLETDYLSYDISISPYQFEKLKLPFEIISENAELIPKIYKYLIIAIIIVSVVLMIVLEN